MANIPGEVVELDARPMTPAMLVLRPGDRALILLVADPPPEEAQEYARQLHQSFPGVEFVIFGGVAGVAVEPGPPPANKQRVRT